MNNINATSKLAPTAEAEEEGAPQLENHNSNKVGPASNLCLSSSVGTNAAAAILSNNGLRQSMQGSTAGLRSLP